MSEQPRLNLDLFQLQNASHGLEVVPGIAVNAAKGGIFIDPQDEPGSPSSYGPAYEEDLILGVSSVLARDIRDGRLHHASLALKDNDHRFNLLEPLGIDKLAAPSVHPLGRAALIGLAERSDFTLTNLHHGQYNPTRILHQAYFSHAGEETIYDIKLILLAGTGGHIEITYKQDRFTQTTRLQYDDRTPSVYSETTHKEYPPDEDEDDGGENDSGGSHDPEPRTPIAPLDAGSVALEPPIEPETDEDLDPVAPCYG